MAISVLAGDIIVLKNGGVPRRWRIYSVPLPWSADRNYRAFMLGRDEPNRTFEDGHDELVALSAEDIAQAQVELRH